MTTTPVNTASQGYPGNNVIALMTGAKGGYRGITAAADGGTGSILDITIAAGTASAPVWALLGDGTFLPNNAFQGLAASALAVAGNTVNGTYKLWVDADATGTVPSFSVSAAGSPPSTRAVAVGTVTVASNVISAYVAITAGITL